MKRKTGWDRLNKEIENANKDPEFVEAVKDFINITSHMRIYKI